MQYKIWNKIDNINNATAEYMIHTHNISNEDEVFVLLDKNDKVLEFHIKNNIISNYNLDKNLSVEEVAEAYIKIKEDEKLQAEKEQINLEDQEKKISILEAENEILKQELSITQDAVNELIFNSLNI